ncbi:hypothetical protein Slin15195_G072870 [Septoria linicola]|uniref:Uncharacterized protein n=1 Tax=Septoria linicola TaxID=215465 RepID=A0A9Q9AXM9_9PEZI|nr:hypothetical protein Slin14017_G105590 [Septoria linicola]USW53968.1 hypothetical protein Slin15195_G072870 [Septoria linicola]
MSRVTPSARTWTLRFKNHTSTVLLEVDPLQRLGAVREELLHALIEATPGGKLNGHDVPKNADYIKLGIANDRNELSKGYSSIEVELEDVNESGKGKGKAAVGKTKSGFAALKDCPQGIGLKNGDVVAFKFIDADHDIHGEDSEEFVEEWDVVVPTIEDSYREDDEGLGMDEG